MPAGQRQCTRPRSLARYCTVTAPNAGRAWRRSPQRPACAHAAALWVRACCQAEPPRGTSPAGARPTSGGGGGVCQCVLSASGVGCERGGRRPPARTLSARRAAGEAQAGPRAPAPLRTEPGACDQADTARTFCTHWHPAYGEQHDRSRSTGLDDAWRPPDRGHRAPIARQVYAQCRPGVNLLVVSVRWQMRPEGQA